MKSESLPTLASAGKASIFAILTTTCQLSASATFEFSDGNALDGSGIGASLTTLDTVENQNITLTTVDVIGQDGSKASDDPAANNTMNSQGSTNALGVNSATNSGGYSSESRDFNPGEGWTFQFDIDIRLTELDFNGWSAQAEITISSSTFADIILNSDGSGDDIFALGDVLVTADTPITMTMTSDDTAGNDTGVRLSNLIVAAEPVAATGADLDWNGGAVGDWNSTDINFLDMATAATFATGDNVTISSAATITLDAAGIVAGNVFINHSTPETVTLTGGNLTSNSLTQSGTGILQIDNDTTTSVTVLSDGQLEIPDNRTLITDALSLSGGSELVLGPNGSLSVNSSSAIGFGGANIENNSDLTLLSLINLVELDDPDEPGFSEILAPITEIPLGKSGSGVLTFSGGLGSQTTGPILLDILAGSVRVSGTGGANQINIGGNGPAGEIPISSVMTFDGQLLLDGPVLMVHNSQITGAGSIVVETPSAIESRFSIGPVQIDVPINLMSDLDIDASTGDSQMSISGIIDGTGNLSKVGNGQVTLSAVSTYIGDTTIEAGSLSLDNAFLPDTHSISISGNGLLNLPHGEGDTVDTLFIDDMAMPAGTYGSAAVTAVTLDIVNDTRFQGTGYLIVSNGPALNDYGTWSLGFGLIGDMAADDDGDGVSNGEEYIFGLIPNDASSSSPLTPIDPATGQFTYTRRSSNLASLTYSYDYSLTLDNDWIDFTADSTEVSDNGDPVETVTVTIPASLLANDKLFVRAFGL